MAVPTTNVADVRGTKLGDLTPSRSVQAPARIIELDYTMTMSSKSSDGRLVRMATSEEPPAAVPLESK